MPAGVSLFLLWGAPVAAMAIGGFVVYKVTKKSASKATEVLPGVKKRKARKLMEKYDKEWTYGKEFSKNPLKNYKKKNLNFFQKILKKLKIKSYGPKPLSQRQRDKRLKKMHKLSNYLEKKDIDYNAPNYKANIKPTRMFEQNINKPSQRISKREFYRAERIVKRASDYSSVKSMNPGVIQSFNNFAKEDKLKDTSNKEFNQLNIYTNKKPEQPVEAIKAKDKHMYYTVGAKMLNDLAESAPNDIFPISIKRSKLTGDKKSELKSYTKEELTKLASLFEESARRHRPKTDEFNNSKSSSKTKQSKRANKNNEKEDAQAEV